MMKTTEQIRFEIDGLEKLITDLEEQIEVSQNNAKISLIKLNISKNKTRIKALKWVLEE